jgi:hypothetical protein
MAEHHEKKLSRGVSQDDLAAALTSLPSEQENIVRNPKEELLSLRPKNEKKNGAHVEFVGIGSRATDGAMTPPNFVAPAPPPPTPASPGTPLTLEEGVLKERPNGLAPIVAEGEEKKKKKKKKKGKSSGTNRKTVPTGFEGSCFVDS